MDETLNTDAIGAEVLAILTDGGAESAGCSFGSSAWVVECAFATRGYGVTEDDPHGLKGTIGPKPYYGSTLRTGMDPRDLARHFVEEGKRHQAQMETFFASPVAPVSEEVETPGDESDSETGEASDDGEQLLGADASEGAGVDDGAGDGVPGEGAEVLGAVDFGDADGSNDAELPADFSGSIEVAGGVDFDTGAIDADFTEGQDLGSELLDVELDLEPPQLGEEIRDFTPDEILPEEHPSGAFIFGPPADDTEALRSQRIGDVVRLSFAKQATIWEASGTTQSAYQDLVSAVMRDTNQGVYTGPSDQFERFNALQSTANAASAVARHERDQIALLTHADRPALDAFDPEAGWP